MLTKLLKNKKLCVKKQFFADNQNSGFSAMEVLIALAFLGFVSLLAVKSGLVTLRAKEVGRGAVNSTAAAQMILNILKDPTTCASTNIVSEGMINLASSVTIGGMYYPNAFGEKLFSFSELRVGDTGSKKGYRIAKVNDRAQLDDSYEATAINLYQTLSPLGKVAPFRAPGYLEVYFKAKSNLFTNSGSGIQYIFPIMLSSSDGIKVDGCYAVFSRKIACEDMGWIYDPVNPDIADKRDCKPPA